jgi:hypothetical protein
VKKRWFRSHLFFVAKKWKTIIIKIENKTKFSSKRMQI